MDASIAALLGALIGAAAGVAGQITTAIYTNRAERRKLAVEAGFREWEQTWQIARAQQSKGEMMPVVAYVHFNNELLGMLDSGFTPERYREVVRRRNELRQVIEDDTKARRAARVAQANLGRSAGDWES